MIVRCGRCRIELDVPGAGEFVCPSCGTRNVVRGGADPYQVPDLGLVGGRPSPPPVDQGPPPGVSWVVCPACSWRFAVGELSEVPCPNCSVTLAVEAGSARLAGN